MLWPPKGGLPGEGNGRYAIASNLPVYGTGDAGRRFYKAFRDKAILAGLAENEVMKSFYSYSKDGEIKVVMGTHVDDLLHASVPEYEYIMKKLLSEFEIKETQEGEFRFCGREYKQFDDFSIKVTAKDNTEKTLPISYAIGNRTPEDKASIGECSQLRSVNGSLAWIARQCRAEKTYMCSKLQSVVNIAQVKHLEVANQLLQEMKDTSEQGLFFKSGVFRFHDAIMITISDASWANDTKVVETDEGAKLFPKRSQFGRITLLGQKKLWNEDSGYVPVSYTHLTLPTNREV